jgi:hypothetical protein
MPVLSMVLTSTSICLAVSMAMNAKSMDPRLQQKLRAQQLDVLAVAF